MFCFGSISTSSCLVYQVKGTRIPWTVVVGTLLVPVIDVSRSWFIVLTDPVTSFRPIISRVQPKVLHQRGANSKVERKSFKISVQDSIIVQVKLKSVQCTFSGFARDLAMGLRTPQ